MQDIVRRVRVPIMSAETCKSLPLTNYKTITPRMFCAGLLNGTKDSCQVTDYDTIVLLINSPKGI